MSTVLPIGFGIQLCYAAPPLNTDVTAGSVRQAALCCPRKLSTQLQEQLSCCSWAADTQPACLLYLDTVAHSGTCCSCGDRLVPVNRLQFLWQ